MHILVDILHPAHVHFFKNFHHEMKERGHEFCITARAKECSMDLLDRYQIPYHHISTQRSGRLGLTTEMIARTYRLARIARKFRPDVLTGIMGPSIAVAGKLLRIPSVIFYDTEFATQTNWFSYPLAHSVCTPDRYQGKVNGVHKTYSGYHELAYLHPSRFTVDPARLCPFGVFESDCYSIIRFVSWQAAHDTSEKGLTLDQKRKLVGLLKTHGQVLISSEAELPEDLESLRVRGPIEDIHHLLAYAQIVVGESATMASESAVLGVPAVFIAKTGRGYSEDEEKRYGLVQYFREDDFDQAINAIQEVFANLPQNYAQKARERLLRDKIDVTEWMVRYFEERFGESI